jgi:putative methanogenesis marker protein 8
MTDRHVMECLGKSRVTIENGKVVDVSEPLIKYCPLFKKYRGINEITAEIVKKNMEFRIENFGMCTENREIKMKDFLSFGVSETLSSSLKENTIDAAVIAADGCGTVIVTDPEIVQGLGGRISGLCETSPISNVIKNVGEENVLEPSTAKIDMFAGAKKAKDLGHSVVAVTVASANDAVSLRRSFGSGIIVIAVHTSGTSEEDAVRLFDNCDIITACASDTLRKESKKRNLLIAGSKIPIYGVSDIGKEMIKVRLKEIGKQPWDGKESEDLPRPLI